MRSMKPLCAAFLLVSASVTMAGAQTPAGDPPDKPRTRVDWNPRPSLRIGNAARIDFRLKLQLDFRTLSPDQPDRRRSNGRFFDRQVVQRDRYARVPEKTMR